MNAPRPIGNIEPTTTANIVFEKVDTPFNRIPGGFSLQEVEEITQEWGDGIVITEDSNNNNRIIVTIPALTVAESHEVLCEIFDSFSPPRILVKESPDESIRIWVDMDLFKYSNTPFLLTHKFIDRSSEQLSLIETNKSKALESLESPIPTDFAITFKDFGFFLTKIEAILTVKDQFGNIMPDVEVVASAESNRNGIVADVNPLSAITDSNGNVMFTLSLPFLGATVTFKANELSTTYAMGPTSIRPVRN